MFRKFFLLTVIILIFIIYPDIPSLSQNVSIELKSCEPYINLDEHTKEPYIAGVGGVSFPERISESYIVPLYPGEAKEKKIGGAVILLIVVKKDGVVGDIKILRSSVANLGFEKSSTEAVKQWRYKPATYKDEPVDVYLTIQITFEINEKKQNENDTHPQQEPLIAGVGGVTYPERIPSNYVKPLAPDIALKKKIKERIILKIVVKRNGTVGDIEVLSAPDSEYGFKDKAIDYVKQWKYKPAMKDGKPVDVCMTVSITFELP